LPVLVGPVPALKESHLKSFTHDFVKKHDCGFVTFDLDARYSLPRLFV
jgi:hypothetical protein